MQAFGTLAKDPVRDHVAAISVGVLGGTAMLDLCYEEDSQAEVDMNIVMTGAGEFVELQATAEKVAFGDDQLAKMLDLGRKGIGELIAMQKEIISGA